MKRGFGLIEILITVAIIGFMVVVMLKEYSPTATVKDDQGNDTTYRGAIQSANDAKNVVEQRSSGN